MESFIKALEMELRLYRRGIWIWVVTILLTLYLASGYYVFVRSNMGAGQLLQSSAYIVMAGFLLGMVAGIISARREQTVKFEEVMASLPGDFPRSLAKMSAWAFIVLVLTIISSALILMIYVISGSQLIYFWGMTVKYIVVYWTLTLLTAGLIGFSIERMIRSKLKYLLIFLLWLLTSPYNGLFYLPKPIAFWLNQGQTDPGAIYDAYTGFEVTQQTINIHLFLLTLSIALVCFSFFVRRVRDYTKKGKWNLLTITAVFSAVAISFPLFTIMHADPRAMYSEDYFYYRELQNELPLKKPFNVPPTFNVSDYRVVLNHQDQNISYSIDMSVNVPQPNTNTSIEFTLSHRMRVSEVSVENGKVDFKQEGDILRIQWPNSVVDGKLHLAVNGSPGIGSPVTFQSFFLSSSFPWYPVPGRWRVASLPAYGYDLQYENVEFPYPVNFDVTVVNQHQKLYSNLDQTDFNHFVGRARGITLLKGNLLEEQIGGNKVIAPPDLIKQIPSLLPQIQNTADKIGEQLKVKSPVIPRNIFVVPLPDRKMALLSDQLQLDVTNVQLFSFEEHRLFANPNLVLRSFFWENRSHDGNSPIGPTIMFSLYDQLYGGDPKNPNNSLHIDAKRPKPNYPELQPIAQKLLAFYEKGNKDELKMFLSNFYKQLSNGDVDLTKIETMVDQITGSN
ncbi:ABC transporter permease [Effusibacillus consociatus]|uniref:ABC transporter permease n=1 Tax=Effusibacillus consociatus TaxID=1117041 RepID=A0ABV9PW86_9BACL